MSGLRRCHEERAATALVISLAALALVAPPSTLAAPPSRLAARPLGDHAGSSRSHLSDAPARAARRADSPSENPAPPIPSPAARSPAQAPLLSGADAATGGDEPQAGGSPGAEADPLVSNGLGSPLCSGAPGGPALSPASRRNCETSGFVAAAAPTGNFGIDVHIDTGVLGLSSAQLLAIVQDLLVTPLWMALVWAVHALVVMLEWCFTIDLLEGDSLRGGVAEGLHAMQATITMPWLATVLAIAAVLCAYQGLVRRRVAESLAQALMALAMMAGGIWLTVDPAGTVGALGDWANRASLGTLAVTARGSPGDSGGALATSMGLLFTSAIEVPWCYLEFGDVDWCRNPSRLDPRLHGAALALAKSELEGIGCGDAARHSGCSDTKQPAPSATDAKAIEHSALLLRTARTNGAIFLALPPNGPGRNAINDPTSLLRAICRSETATDCQGPAAAPAEFRTNHGTWSRVGGLLLITAGVLGMLLLLSFLALRLLGAAIFSLVYLMLAPAAALAPALGETGRAVFRKWAAQLLAAVLSKLLFAFLLGVVLAVLAILEHLEALGWWTRWLLMSAFWWGLFARRHQVLQLAGGGRGEQRTTGRRPVLRRVNDTLDARARVQRRVRDARERSRKPGPELARDTARTPRQLPSRGTSAGPAGTRDRSRPATVGDAAQSAAAADAAAAGSRTVARSGKDRLPSDAASGAPLHRPVGDRLAARLKLIADQRALALAAGNPRRAARLAARGHRIESEARSPAGGDRQRERAAGGDRADAQARHARFLEAQARLLAPGEGSPESGKGGKGEPSYAALAGAAGYGGREYRRLDAAGKRLARELIDRELAARREHGPLRPARRPAVGSRSESDVMRDAREVAAGRKRQLGPDRP